MLTLLKRNEPWYWLNQTSKQFLARGYLPENQQAKDRIRYIAEYAERQLGIEGFADKFYEYMSKGWFSLSSPVWANYGLARGFPISCFGSYIGDSIEDIMNTVSEVGMMNKFGGGTQGYFGHIRPRGSVITGNGISDGSFNFTKLFDSVVEVISQGSCYEEGTEVLTNKGWKDFRNVSKTDKIAQVDKFGNITYTDKYELVKQPYSGKMYKFYHKGLMDVSVTPNHRMVVDENIRIRSRTKENPVDYSFYKGSLDIFTAEELANKISKGHRGKMLTSGKIKGSSDVGLSDIERFRIAFQADGSKDGTNRKIRFHFSKARKIERLLELASRLNLEYNLKELDDGTTYISFDYDERLKFDTFSWVNFDNISVRWAQEFIDELSNWDGHLRKNGFISYAQVDPFNVDVVQILSTLCGYSSNISVRPSSNNRRELHRIFISKDPGFVTIQSLTPEEYSYDGMVYCAVVPEGRLVIRTKTKKTLICGNTRRGQFAGYIDIEHGDIDEWLDIHTEGNPIQIMYYGVVIGRKWLDEMKAGDKYKRQIWGKLLKRRAETGIPYIMFRDNVNENSPDVYQDKNLQIFSSNLCSEIALSQSLDESFVCCLSQMNLLHYEEWKDTDAPEVLTYFLDAVMEEFIQKASKVKALEKAVNFAKRQRALGIGALGWHSYLQSKMIPFESDRAFQLNNEIFSLLQEKTLKASKELAERYGEPELLKGYGRRNTTLMSIAPTKQSSALLGQVSPSIEPLKSNYFIKDLAKTSVVFKNPFLVKLLQEKGLDTPEIWKSILEMNGSVQHLTGLTQEERDVFKTFEEISPLKIIQQAAQRQQYIDQSQSLNITVHPGTPMKDISKLYITAEELGIKSLYYQFSVNKAQEFTRQLIQDNTCSSCEA